MKKNRDKEIKEKKKKKVDKRNVKDKENESRKIEIAKVKHFCHCIHTCLGKK